MSIRFAEAEALGILPEDFAGQKFAGTQFHLNFSLLFDEALDLTDTWQTCIKLSHRYLFGESANDNPSLSKNMVKLKKD